MTATCLSGSILINRLGFRYALALGTVGYSIYSAALYQNNRHGTKWFIYLGSAACGITAGFFWAAEGAIMLSYPPPENRGKYLAYWLAYRNSGSILGGAINLAFNYSGRSLGKLDWRTYIVFVVLRMLPALSLAVASTDVYHRVSWACSCIVAFEPGQGAAKQRKQNPHIATNSGIDRIQRDNEADAAERVPASVSFLHYEAVPKASLQLTWLKTQHPILPLRNLVPPLHRLLHDPALLHTLPRPRLPGHCSCTDPRHSHNGHLP